MNGRKHIPSLDEYDNGAVPTLSVWDEWDMREIEDAWVEFPDAESDE